VSGLELVVALVMVAGLVGIVVPILPGLVLIAGAAGVWALSDPQAARWLVAGGVAAIALAATLAAAVLPARRASAAGAPRSSLFAGAAGMVAGFVMIPVIGALLGFPVGIYAAELVRLRDGRAARDTTVAALRGVGIGIAIQLVAGVTMIGIWVVAVVIT
jgi:uncharacterized protein YqgC (DUF456 family)